MRNTWDDISPFIKYGCIKDAKFSEKVLDYTLLKDLDNKYFTLPDYIEANKPAEETKEAEETAENNSEEKTEEKADEKEKSRTILYYVTDEIQQSQYINMFRSEGKDAVILKHNIDSAFITHVEREEDEVPEVIDADVTSDFKEEVSADALKEETDTLTELFRKVLGKDKLEVKVEKLKNADISIPFPRKAAVCRI